MRNIYKVPKKQWKSWSKVAKEVFNRTYNFIYNNQRLMTHPKATPVTDKFWKTISWNSAWIAADAVDDSIPDYIVEC